MYKVYAPNITDFVSMCYNFEYLILMHYFKTGRYLNAKASAEGASENKYNILLNVNANTRKREKYVSERK